MSAVKDVKEPLLPSQVPLDAPPVHPRKSSKLTWACLGASVLVACTYLASQGTFDVRACMHKAMPVARSADLCPQASALYPSENGDLWKTVGGVISSEEFKTRAIDWLGGAVRVPYE